MPPPPHCLAWRTRHVVRRALQAFEWAAHGAPDGVERIAAVCGAARCGGLNGVFLSSIEAALKTDGAWDAAAQRFSCRPERCVHSAAKQRPHTHEMVVYACTCTCTCTCTSHAEHMHMHMHISCASTCTHGCTNTLMHTLAYTWTRTWTRSPLDQRGLHSHLIPC